MKQPAFRPVHAIAATAIAIATPAAAEAQDYTAAYSAKASAILGGAPSRLAMIMAQQQGLSAQAAFEPAALAAPVRRAVIDRYQPLRPLPQRYMVRNAEPWTGKPDLFGTVALKVGRTPLDARWDRVAAPSLSGSARTAARALASLDPVARVEAVNRYVNRRVDFVDDRRQHGRADLWSAAADTLTRGRGDCEDYAVAKMQMLRAAGIPSKDLYLVLVRDLVRMADHAVLVVRADGRNLVLDNSTDTVLDAENVRDYRPVFTFASTGTWTHGYRRQRNPSMEWASVAANLPSAFKF